MPWSPDATATCCATLVDEWIACGLRHAMVSPGSRSTPMALALAERSEIALEVFLDERSASFAALGAALVSGSPALALCTSGTAAVEFHPAAVEADHAGVPLLLLTADRPPDLIGRGAPQTIDQRALYGTSSRAYLDVGLADDEQTGRWRGIARRAWSAAVGPRPGPVQVNLPFREPLLGRAHELPPRDTMPLHEVIAATDDDVEALRGLLGEEHGVIVAGWGVDDPRAVLALGARIGWPVFADPRSGCRDRALTPPGAMVVRHADPVLRVADVAAELSPRAVLRLGEPPASKVVNAWLNASGARQMSVDPRGRLVDPEAVLERLVHAPIGATCDRLADRRGDGSWSARFAALDARAAAAIAATVAPLGEIDVARRVARLAPEGSTIVVSSSMPVRDIEWYADDLRGVRVLANRGVNGIDGVLSSAIGVGAASGAPVVLLIGDVALLHDSSALAALARRKVDLRIIVVDNDGGGIFSFLPQAGTLPVERFETLFGTPHGTDLVGLAVAHGLPAATATVDDFDRLLAQPGPHLVRIASERATNLADHERVNAAVAAAVSA